jgi:site-specific DNA recombinase
MLSETSKVNLPKTASGRRRAAVLYARVSSKDQEKDGFSIPAQQKLLRAYAADQDLRVLQEFTDVETAKQTGRSSFGAMLAFLRQNPTCRIVLVEKTDRLYRNLKDWVQVDERNLEVHFVKENVVLAPDSRSSEKFMHGIKVLMAKNYIDNLSEEVRKGQLEKAEEGGWPSYAPIGYVNTEGRNGKRTIVPDPERAPLVRKLFEWYVTGDRSIKEVARMARETGLTFRKSRDPITTSRVHQMLRSRLYTGDFDWGGKTYHGTYEPIVSKDLWQRVQDVLDGRLAGRSKRSKHRFAFAGLVRCGHCDCALTGEIHKGRYVYYRCSHYKVKCPEPYAREEALTEQFVAVLDQLIFPPAALEWLTKALRESHDDEKRFRDEATARLEAEWTLLQNRLDAMYIDKLDGRIQTAFFERKAAEWRGEQERIELAIQEHRNADRSYVDEGVQLLELASRAGELFRSQESAEKRELLRYVLSNSTWKGDQLTPTFRQPFDLILDQAHKVRAAEDLPSTPAGIAAKTGIWREGRDSNPGGNVKAPYSLSRRALSTTQPPPRAGDARL